MSEKSLEEILHQLHDERVACEQVLASVHALASGELKAVFDKAITLAKLESQLANPQVSDQVVEVVSSYASKMELVSSQLESATELLEKRTEDLKRFQRRCTMLGGTCFALAFCCSAFIGWTGYSYWMIKATTSSFWFQTIIVENAQVINKCLDPEVLRHSDGKCTIQLPFKVEHLR
jgi:hypothetical protein